MYIVSKSYHVVCDGLSLLQMFSLMQDGGDQVATGSNRVAYPNRLLQPLCGSRDSQNRLKALKMKIGPNTVLQNLTN